MVSSAVFCFCFFLFFLCGSCSDKIAKPGSVSLQCGKAEGSRKTSMIAPRSSLKLISSSKSEEEQSPRTSACTALPLLQAAFTRKEAYKRSARRSEANWRALMVRRRRRRCSRGRCPFWPRCSRLLLCCRRRRGSPALRCSGHAVSSCSVPPSWTCWLLSCQASAGVWDSTWPESRERKRKEGERSAWKKIVKKIY